MTESSTDNGHAEARAMCEAFASVGATSFDVTWTTRGGDKARFRRSLSSAYLTHALPQMIDEAAPQQHNVIVRPNGRSVTFTQLDDLKAKALPRLAALAVSPHAGMSSCGHVAQ
jgi:hypothetical protein